MDIMMPTYGWSYRNKYAICHLMHVQCIKDYRQNRKCMMTELGKSKEPEKDTEKTQGED